MHRASDRGEETAGGFPDGEICNEEVGDDNRDSVLYSCSFRACYFRLADVQCRDYKDGGYHSGYRYCAGDRASCQYLRDECAACGRRCELSVLCRAGGDVECSRRTWLSVRHSVGLGHLRHVGSVFAGRKYPRGYFCAPLVQHEMGKQEFYKIMLGEESPVFFMGSKRCVPVKIGKLNGDTLKGV